MFQYSKILEDLEKPKRKNRKVLTKWEQLIKKRILKS